MPVEGAANCVGDRIVVIVAVDKNGKDSGDRTGSLDAGSRALEQAGQIAEHARRVAAGDRGLSRRQRHVARRMRIAGDRIDDEQHRLAQITEIFGDRHRRLRREPAHHRALVAGRDDGDRGAAIFAQRVVEKFPHFAAPLADERDDDRVDRRRARQHGEHCRLADARAREHPHSLPDAERREEIDHAHAGAQRRVNAPAPERRWRRRVERLRIAPRSARSPAPSIGRPSASMTRPFQARCGASDRASARQARAPIAARCARRTASASPRHRRS